MNHSLYSADRATHLKIVVVALVAATVVAGIGVAARIAGADRLAGPQIEAKVPLVKVGPTVTATGAEDRAIR